MQVRSTLRPRSQDGDRTDEEEEEEELPEIRRRTTKDYVDPANPKPQYDAYFPGGFKDAKPVVVDVGHRCQLPF